MVNDLTRRDDDPLYQRRTRLEVQYPTLERTVNALSLEQKHMPELFGARFSTLERSQELTISEVRALNLNITTMASEAGKSQPGAGYCGRSTASLMS